jgi:hypothetical protein
MTTKLEELKAVYDAAKADVYTAAYVAASTYSEEET